LTSSNDSEIHNVVPSTEQKRDKISQSHKKKETNNIVGDIFDFTATLISEDSHMIENSVTARHEKSDTTNPNTELSNDRDEFIDNSSDVLTEAEVCKEIKTLPETEISITTTPSIPLSHISNSEDNISEVKFLPETEVSISTESYISDSTSSKLSQENNPEINHKVSCSVKVMASNKNRLYQYSIEHGINPKEFSIITDAERNRWAMGCFPADLERDIRFYRGGIKRKEDPRKYRKFLTDRERLVGEELLRCSMLKSGLSTAWLDDLMKEWEKIHAQFTQISFEEKTLFVSQVNVQSGPSKLRSPISVLSKDPEERQQHVIDMVLERFPYLTLKHSFKYSNYFDFNRSVLCPLCNKNHKKEKIKSNVEGVWGSGDYVNTKTYRLEFNPNSNRKSIG
ncbi:39399_t:CDS:2, partial [Gigaspora margarita]